MIDFHYPYKYPSPRVQVDKELPGKQLGRLLAAAVINQAFCELLLRDSGQALRTGFNGEYFSLSKDELDLVLSIRASSLDEFACLLERARYPSAEDSQFREAARCDSVKVELFVDAAQSSGQD